MIPLLLAALLCVPAGALTCYGDSGQPVDWFVVYKLPALRGSGEAAQRGLQYKYLDESSGGWRDGRGLINSPERAVGRSLQPLYRSNTSQLAFLLYNDQPPQPSKAQDSSMRGHTKGVLLLDHDGGFWLVHSVPNFPPPASSAAYSWPHSACTYGQTLLCVSFPFAQFSKIGKQLTYTYPWVYNYQNSPTWRMWSRATMLAKNPGTAASHSHPRPGLFSRALPSSANLEMVNLYSGWLAAALGTNLQVQFWHKTVGILPSNCSDIWQVLNVNQIAFPGPAGPSFNSTEDHSKWCVSPKGPWTCVGDMNRNQGEEQRGGGTLCAQLPALWKAFQPLVKNYQPCNGMARKPSRAYKI
uniref:Deoxyribonuclease-2-alpha n=1 Tax=Pan troglodytes TaxID=9598 RepID=H2QFH3_PANTR